MDLLDDPTFKNKYQKNKLRVKRWENDFKEKYGRRPNKDDIRAADNTIKESYKMYYKLKTQALEETLLDITFPDESQANVTANNSSEASSTLGSLYDSVSLDKTLSLETSMKNSENIDPVITERIILPNNPEEIFSSSVNIEETPNIDGAWGSHLNKDNEESRPTKKKSLIIGRSSSFQLSQKLFSSSNLTKRNPRKSLSMNKLKNSKSDLGLNGSLTETSNETKIDGFEIDASKTIFGEGLRVVQGKTKITSQPINSIQELIKGGTTVINRNLNHGWLERCAKDNAFEPVTYNPQRSSGTSDSGIESMDTSDPPTHENFNTPIADKISDFTDSEDFICNSDSEDERRKKRVRNFKKRLSDSACQQSAKRQCIVDNDNNFSFGQSLPDKISTVPSFTENFIEDSGSKKNDETNETITEKSIDSSLKIVKKRASGEKNELDERERDISEKKTKKRASKTTRVTRSTRAKAKIDDATMREVVTVAKKRTTRKKKMENIREPLEDEIAKDTSEVPNIPIYGIEATQVVPRFPMPKNTTGNLIDDCSRSVCTKFSSDKIIPASKPRANLTPREKLEAKVASGRINENYVRINIKKKIFVRGKRSFNSSKYRKNQWKQRKMELSSSDGALDLADFAEKNGGACFKCGGTGHYARRCTAARSEDLLPNLDEEPSDFLTLEEVEKMAAKTAVSAHSTRIDRLPKCPSFLQIDETTTIQRTTSEKKDELSKNNDDGEDEDEDNNENNDNGEAEDNNENYVELFDGDFDEEMTNEQTDVNPPSRLMGHKIPNELLARLLPPKNCTIEPVFAAPSNDSLVETPDEIFQALRMFGHENFRPGQEKAVMRILSGQSTLVTLSTGSGKSLCYQLPAYIYSKRSRCITLVVSPLVSLMDDQVTGIPKFLSAAALHTGQTPKIREQIMQTIRDGKLDILLVSPEAVVAGEKSTGFGALLRQLPPIAFACIDEAHCISQWSHNFRPSYLMICRVLMEKLGVKTILGLTATATKNTAESIVRHLAIHDGISGVISDTPMPKNLTLTVSKDEHRDRALVELVLSERFKDCDSIIVYCTRRDECTRIAGVLRISLQDPRDHKNLKAKCSPYAEAYHAGLTASRRKIIQKSFMSGQTRIVVATVAFGMGINKADIRSVIHYNMPASFEGYVQEVGRAGRDNLPAHCHLFLSPSQDADKLELRRHIFANGVDRHTIRRLLQKIFVPCSCPRVEGKNDEKRCPGHEVAIPIDETVRALDISEETISTLLCYLELHPKRFITVLSSVYVNAKVSSYAGPKVLKMAAQTSPPLAMAIALDLRKGISHEKSTIVEFPVVDIAAAIGWDSGVVKSHLKNLEWQTADGISKRSTISVRYDTLGIRVRAPGDLTEIELDEALDALAERARTQETSALQQLETIHASLNKFSLKSVQRCMELNDDNTSKSESLKEIIREYFRSDTPLSIVELTPQNPSSNEPEITSDVRSLISSYRDNNFTGRAVARIFHGIQSPNYTALTWSRCRFWRSHLSTDFNFICRIATREILATRQ